MIIIDDELFVRKGLIGMIDWESSGFQVIGEADNGEDALALIRAKKPDLVVTDIRMPVLDGIGLIQAAAEEKLETEFVIISGYNDFRYAQQALRFGVHDYVLKPIDEDDMLQALAKLRDKLSAKKRLQERSHIQTGERQIEALIRGELGESALDEWERSWMEAGASSFTYVFIEPNNVLPWNDGTLPAKNTLKAGIQEAAQEAACASSIPIVYEHRRAYGFIIPDLYLTSHGGSIRKFIEAVLMRLDERTGLAFRAYAGSTVSALKQLKLSYVSAKETVSYKYLKHKDKIILYSDIADLDLHYRHLDDEVYRKLIEAVEENEINEINQATNRMFADFLEKRFSPEAIKTAIVQCVLAIGKSVRSIEGDENELESIGPVIGWHDHNVTLEELRRLFEAFVFEAAYMINTLYKNYGKGGIYKIKCYVDQNFHKNMNLKSIAAQFYMNSAYLGQLFKKSYGVYFNDYLQQLRIAEAKKLLRQKDLRIYEIAERVGFNNADYFVTQFEKLEKMTPTEYRNRLNDRS